MTAQEYIDKFRMNQENFEFSRQEFIAQLKFDFLESIVESILNRPKDDNWITAKEACAMLGCKERAFLVKRRAYRLKVLEVGRNKLIRRSDVERIIQAEAYAE